MNFLIVGSVYSHVVTYKTTNQNMMTCWTSICDVIYHVCRSKGFTLSVLCPRKWRGSVNTPHSPKRRKVRLIVTNIIFVTLSLYTWHKVLCTVCFTFDPNPKPSRTHSKQISFPIVFLRPWDMKIRQHTASFMWQNRSHMHPHEQDLESLSASKAPFPYRKWVPLHANTRKLS